jgi:hypothetical protein
MQNIARLYREEHGEEVMNLHPMYDWAVERGLYQHRELDIRKLFRREMGRALGREMTVDPQGRAVKANHAYRVTNQDGQYEWEWAPIETIRPQHMHISLTLRRDSMSSTVIQHHTDWASYNENNVYGAELPLFDYDFNHDIEENQQPEEWPDEDEGGSTTYPFPSA